jgi:iron complex outermembrane recepter protein
MRYPKLAYAASAYALVAGAPLAPATAQENLPTIHVGGARPARTPAPAIRRAATRQTAAPGAARATPAADPQIEKTTAGPVRGYQALTTRATRFETPLKQLPVAVTVIPRRVIDDQEAVSQSEAFRNISGVNPVSPNFPGGATVFMRGMRAERYIDGLPNYYDYGVRDLLANVERIEALKGPASILFQGGSSPVGGVVNVVSKMPTAERFAEVGVRAGSYGYASPWIDVNQPLNESKTVLFRITGQWETTHSNIETLHRTSYSINPTLKLTNNENVSLVIQGQVNRREQRDYPGLPAVGAIDRSYYSLRPTAFLSPTDMPKSRTESSGVTARLDYKFNETFSSFTALRFSRSSLFEPSQSPLGNTPTNYLDPFLLMRIGGPSQFYLVNSLLSEQTHEVSVTQNLMAKFDLGPTKNQLLLGGDYNRVWDLGYLSGANATPPDPNILPILNFFGFGAFAPFYPTLTNFAAPMFYPYAYPAPGQDLFTIFSRIDNTYQNAGATAQLQSTIFEKLHLLAALRMAWIDIHSEERASQPARVFDSSTTRFLPRVGLSYDVLPFASVYGAYAQGLRPVTIFNGPGGGAPKPEGSDQWEAGVKLDGPMGLSGAIDYFDLRRTNVPITPPGSLTQTQSGEWHSSGVEVDLVWQPLANISVLASYAHINAHVSRDENPALLGARLNTTPRDSGRFWANYAFDGALFDGALKGWSVGGGFYAAMGQVVSLGQPQNFSLVGMPWSTSGYITFDAKIAYKHENFTFSIDAKNLSDRQYFVQYPYFDGRVAPGEGRAFFATVSVKM